MTSIMWCLLFVVTLCLARIAAADRLLRHAPLHIIRTRRHVTSETGSPSGNQHDSPSKPEAANAHAPQASTSLPVDPCSLSSIDAISLIRGDYCIFKGPWFWRVSTGGYATTVTEIPVFWYGSLVSALRDGVDAVFERSRDSRIVFFKGSHYWEFTNNHLAPNFTSRGSPLKDLGLPASLPRVDAAFVWPADNRTYLIHDHSYWRLDQAARAVEADYPKDTASLWAGIPDSVDAAFTDDQGTTFFVTGSQYFQLNILDQRTVDPPKPLNNSWIFGCTSKPSITSSSTSLDSSSRFIAHWTISAITAILIRIQL